METDCGEKEKSSPARLEREIAAQEDEEILRKRILDHPLFGLLIENHLNCLKVFQLLFILFLLFSVGRVTSFWFLITVSCKTS